MSPKPFSPPRSAVLDLLGDAVMPKPAGVWLVQAMALAPSLCRAYGFSRRCRAWFGVTAGVASA